MLGDRNERPNRPAAVVMRHASSAPDYCNAKGHGNPTGVTFLHGLNVCMCVSAPTLTHQQFNSKARHSYWEFNGTVTGQSFRR